MTTKIAGVLIGCLAAIAIAGCLKQIPVGEPVETEKTVTPDRPEIPGKPPEPTPRVQASLKLTEQGRQLLNAGKPDSAIRLLEQAISLNPANGKNYYYLSDAWLMKGNITEAREFNRLAEFHLKAESEWSGRVSAQSARIAKMEKEKLLLK